MSWQPHIRPFLGDTLIIASHNKGKLHEIGALLTPFGVSVKSAGDLGLTEPVEDGQTFAENARIKSLAAALTAGLPALSDDSGIEVAALGGRPGIHTADWAEQADGSRDFIKAMSRVNDEMGDTTDRSARFCCTLSLAWPDGHTQEFQGTMSGHLTWPLRGKEGFGFDPMFIPEGYDITFAEMPFEQKQAISHRADAFEQLIRHCFAHKN